ncbi:translation initiation factor 2 [Cellulomonas sp. SLBN-39]|uniref:translation initiation factor 2 n=1 Tax=Cellulomonas sp. SLBN-39 TaxID=2768446 RepID=UPI002101F1B9|nr:translation initiation factor 2 [Cellulomonas sp. SLBN-39]
MSPPTRALDDEEERTMSESHDAESRLAHASRVATQELHKQGTPDYDPRAHERAVEAERKAAEAVRAQREGTA